MDVKTLYTFIAVVDHGSFADAAAVLGVSASAISVQMRNLEDDVQQVLFDRGRRPPVLTSEGYAFAERARTVIEKWEELSETLRRNGDNGVLKVGSVHTAVSGLLPQALLNLRKTVPGLEIRLTTGLTHELESLLRAGRIDAAIVTEPLRLAQAMAFEAICEERLVVVSHQDAHGNTDREILAQNPYVRFSRQARVAEMVEAQLAAQGLTFASHMEVDTLDGVLSLVRMGLGVSIVPERIGATGFPEAVRVHQFGKPPVLRRLGILTRQGNARQRFCDLLREAMRDVANQRQSTGNG